MTETNTKPFDWSQRCLSCHKPMMEHDFSKCLHGIETLPRCPDKKAFGDVRPAETNNRPEKP